MAKYISAEIAKKALDDSNLIPRYTESCKPITGRIIDSLTAADVEPVRHGNWNIRLADEMTLCLECSICGRRVDNIDLHCLLEAGEYGEACRRYPYCHCGAKMDWEGN